MGKLESKYQRELKQRIQDRFPGCLVLKNDEQLLQGVPDLTILWGSRYAVLEVKRSEKEMRKPRPNQQYYLDLVEDMGGISAFIYPEIEEEVLDALQRSFQSRW